MILTITLNTSIDKRYVVNGAENGKVNRVLSCSYTAGGKGLNVARVLALGKSEVMASGFVGGHAGSYIEERLGEEGIPCRFYHVTGESRSCINIWDEKNKTQTEYLEPGFEASEKDVEGFLSLYQELLAKAEVVSLSGSAPRRVAPDIYAKMIHTAKKQGKRVLLDTSSSLLAEGLKAGPTLIKPNIDEIRALTGRACQDMEELVQAAEALHRGGIEYVVISLGGDGSLMVCNEGVLRAQVPSLKTVNTVGCGDSMIAGFAEGLEKGESAERMLQRASAVSAAAALDRETGHYEAENFMELYKKVNISLYP